MVPAVDFEETTFGRYDITSRKSTKITEKLLDQTGFKINTELVQG